MADILTDPLRETLTVFDSAEPRTTPEVATCLDVGRRSTYTRLERLVDRDRLETKKVGANARVWWRPTDEDGAMQTVHLLEEIDAGAVVRDGESNIAYINDMAARYLEHDESTPSGVVADDSQPDDVTQLHVPIDQGNFAGGHIELHVSEDDVEPDNVDRLDQLASVATAVEQYALFALDPDGDVQSWNPGAEQLTGYASDGVLDEHVSVFYTEEDRAAGVPQENLEAATRAGAVEAEGWRVRADGTRFWADVTITPMRDDDGEVIGFAKVIRDVTERREQEERLREQRDFIEKILDTSPIGVLTVEQDGTFSLVNERSAELLGLGPDVDNDYQVGRKDVYDERGEYLAPTERPYMEVFETGEPVRNWRAAIDMPDGSRRWLSTNIEPMYEDGDVARALVTLEDISQLKAQAIRLERQRDELQAELDDIFTRIDEGFLAVDNAWRIDYANDRALDTLDRTAGELTGSQFWDILDDLDDGYPRRQFEWAMETGEAVALELHMKSVGTWLEFRGYPGTSGMSVYVRDVSRRKEREQELTRFKRAVEASGHAIYMADPDGRITFVNRSFEKLTGYDAEDVLGESPAILNSGEHHEEYYDDLWNTVLSGDIWEEEITDRRNDGSLYHAEQTIAPVSDERGDIDRFVAVQKDITGRLERQRRLERQGDQLAAMNSLHEAVRDITDAVIDQSTRDEIEETVCERLADSPSYRFAWVGEADAKTQTVEPRTAAGTEGYLDGLTISIDPDDERSHGPTGRAFRTGEIQTAADVEAESQHGPWRDQLEPYAFRSSAAVPITHEDTLFGVLNVYADRTYAFEGTEGELIAHLGEVIGHAIAAAERKKALLSDELVELEFRLRDVYDKLEAPLASDERITLDQVVQISSGDFILYGTADPDAMDAVRGLVDVIPSWESLTVRSEGKPIRYEILLNEPPVLSVVARLGGYVDSKVMEGGDLFMNIHLAPTVDIRQVMDAVREEYPTAEMIRRRQITRPRDDLRRIQRRLLSDLTDRQRAALDASFHAGFFEWPRDASGEEVAESLGIAPATFSQHLRTAQKRVFERLYPDIPSRS